MMTAFYTFTKSFLRLLLIFIVSWALSNQALSFEDICILLAVCCITLISFIGISMVGLAIILIYTKGDYLSLIFVGGSLIISGAIYPNDVLPQILIYFSEFLPLTHALDIIRNELVEKGVNNSSYLAILKLVFLAFLYLLLGYLSISKAIDISRKKGTFSHY